MPEFEVTVYTRVREVYAVTADSAEQARAEWAEGALQLSECESVEGIGDVEAVSE